MSIITSIRNKEIEKRLHVAGKSLDNMNKLSATAQSIILSTKNTPPMPIPGRVKVKRERRLESATKVFENVEIKK